MDSRSHLIIANGNFLVKEIILEAMAGQHIVALDGAAHKLIPLNILPHLIIGDMDSINHDAIIHHHIKTIRLDDQNTTDLIKAIRYCDTHGAEQISIICATGGRLDHHEAAVRALRAEYKPNRTIIMHTEQQSIRFAKNESVTLRGEVGDKCGILAYPQGRCTSNGLQYEMNNYELIFGFADSTSNILKTPTASINIEGEALIIMPPQLSAQRAYMQLSNVEQLERQLRDALVHARY